MTATSLLIVAPMAAGAPVPSCSESNIGLQSVGCMCRRAAAGGKSCQDMLAIRRAPEVAPRRSRLHTQVVQLSLLIATFRPDALRSHS